MKKIIIIGIVLIAFNSIGFPQDTLVRVNIERLKTSDGKQYSSDGKIKISINVAVLEQYYKWAATEDTIVCYLIPEDWSKEAIVKAMTAYMLYNNNLEVHTPNSQNSVSKFLEAYSKTHLTKGN